MIEKAKVEFEASFFVKAFSITRWAIFKERNGYIFRQIRPIQGNRETEPIFSGKPICSCIG
jgi:hypothetical protein